MKYVVIDARDGDVWTSEHDNLEDAIADAKQRWYHLTADEKDESNFYILESQNPDEEAEDHLDGDTVWEPWEEGDERRLDRMPYDHGFYVNGNYELCHATGYEVFIDGEWWNEYIDSEGNSQYGR